MKAHSNPIWIAGPKYHVRIHLLGLSVDILYTDPYRSELSSQSTTLCGAYAYDIFLKKVLKCKAIARLKN